ncbi:uncharacterized protein BDZ99DRAFT_524914 [Mytilinidion resinicola]|uniref:Glycosyl transferase CAP10 domain-containing protein n=1 Tax=Mytilinidion resinicola TaxID=574789 RepID=A0A6A6Y8P5_9PEZI|nr:uncharacterized protein BDZ99DRAFT_524914 [Mytilinidion resinicola]KAF2805201.1 hypothetical protein BDZ99DRAFT_524914 [Mytilinidion resinicola]
MDAQKLISSIGLVAGLVFLPGLVRTSFAIDRPIHSSIVVLAVCGACIIGLDRTRALKDTKSHRHRYGPIPLEDASDRRISGNRSVHGEENGSKQSPLSSLRRLRLVFLILVGALCARVEVLHQVAKGVQCTRGSYQPFLPFLLAVYDFAIIRRHRQEWKPDEEQNGSPFKQVFARLSRHRYMLVLSTLLLGLCSSLELSATAPPSSTYICATTLPTFTLVPAIQLLGLFLDALIFVLVFHILDLGSDSPQSNVNAPRIIGWAFLLSAVVWTIIGALVFFVSPDDRHWILTPDRTYLWSLFNLTLAVCITVLFAVSVASRSRPVSFSFLVVFTLTGMTALTSDWSQHIQNLGFSDKLNFVFVITIFVADILYAVIEMSAENRSRSSMKNMSGVPGWFLFSIAGLLIFRLLFGNPYLSQPSSHPIDTLIGRARSQHDLWKKQASSSKSLSDAVAVYRQRYHRNPPPQFDIWYNYATSRSSLVIDDYDNIYNDLLPYWSLSPAEIRQRTWEIIANPWSDAGGVHVRAGSLEISANMPGTHRWMVDGVTHIMEKFAEWLPDMDLAFNLNDEARVTVPFEVLEALKVTSSRAAQSKTPGVVGFSNERSSGWAPIPEQPIAESRFQQRSFQRTFYGFGAVGCPPSSRAQKERLWNVKDLCTTCAAPHSLGYFLSNWTLSASVCHQPDLADLHGLNLSPAAFKGSYDLMPMFSQSKPAGYNDILYPSAWNYMDKVKYAPSPEFPDPPFSNKENTIFWRGATSEGVSAGSGVWKGMARQRLVHLANNATTPQLVLLPQPRTNKPTYIMLEPTSVAAILNSSIRLVDGIARCGGRDCPDQTNEFGGSAPRSDFQHHWHYRFLVDADGAGFSGRFLPFLQSGSVPFKTALFREWYEGRLTAWRHFVPLDLRLHGLWSTLAYFAGVDGRSIGGRVGKWEARAKEAEDIAENGRKWANTVLRKEDMEIYFFRLLLEWGRLTDDRRDELGFSV